MTGQGRRPDNSDRVGRLAAIGQLAFYVLAGLAVLGAGALAIGGLPTAPPSLSGSSTPTPATTAPPPGTFAPTPGATPTGTFTKSPVADATCDFASEIVMAGDIIQELYIPPGSDNLAGYQIAFSRSLEIPPQWTVQIYESTPTGPYVVQPGDVATIWAPVSCRPLRVMQSSPSPTPAATPQPPSLVAALTVPRSSPNGIRFAAPQTGRYELRYVGGAYSTYADGRQPRDQATWLASVCFFAGDPVWNGQTLRVDEAYLLIGWGGQYFTTRAAAEQAAAGQSFQTEMTAGSTFTLLTVDSQNSYRDNGGADVKIEIWFVPR